MIKKYYVLIIVVFMLFLIPACGSNNSEYVGRWIGRTAEYNGAILSIQDVYGFFDLDLHSDGSVTVIFGKGNTFDSTWEESANGISINGGAFIFEKSGNDLVGEYDGMTVTLVKEENYTPYSNGTYYGGGGSSYDNDSTYDDWDTDDNGVGDWRDVDTDNDGEISSDEMGKYLDDWETEENAGY